MINNIYSLFKGFRKTSNSFTKRYTAVLIVCILSLLAVIFYPSTFFSNFKVEVTQAIAFPLSSEDMNETNFSFEKKENYYFKQVAGLNLTLFQYK